jgi:hypothetical protein
MTTIKYLNDSSHSIQYTNAEGSVVVLNPFDQNYSSVVERFNSIQNATRVNMINRKNYEDAVRNAQRNIDISRSHPPLPTPPECEFWPDDYTLPGSTIAWKPPLLTVKEKTVQKSGEGDSIEKEQISARPPETVREMIERHRRELEALLAKLPDDKSSLNNC